MSRRQWAHGDQNVQIQEVSAGARIEVVFGGRPARPVPLESACVPVGPQVVAPSRLLRARAAVVPWTARSRAYENLLDWLTSPDPYAIRVLGGRGGSGKTRLAVQLCVRAQAEAGWLCGLLRMSTDREELETLTAAAKPRLVVVDYAETRGEQLEVLLPALQAAATNAAPVRILLLVRAAPPGSDDWTIPIRTRGELLDVALDPADQLVLQDEPFELAERTELFDAAVAAFGARRSAPVAAAARSADSGAQPDLSGVTFATPLSVVIAAFLATAGERDLPTTREELLAALARREDRYWQDSAAGLDTDVLLRRRVAALASLAGARSEDEAARLLSLLPDLTDASAERRRRLARWAHGLYPGQHWWNAVEPDLLAEYLTATTFSEQPGVLAGVLDRVDPADVIQPLDLFARAAPDHPQLATALREILAAQLARLCAAAVVQAGAQTRQQLLLGAPTLAAALSRLATLVPIPVQALREAERVIPPQPNVILSPLALTITLPLVDAVRRLRAAKPAAYKPELAGRLNNLSLRLGEVGRWEEGLAAIEESVKIYRGLAAANPAEYEHALATSLNNLSVRLGKMGRREEGLTAIEESVEIYRRLAAANPAAHEPNLARWLNTLSLWLGEAGRNEEGLAAIEQAVEVHWRLAAANPAAYEPDLAMSLNNLSMRLAKTGRSEEALAAIGESIEVYRRLAAVNPAAYEPDLGTALNNLSLWFGGAGRSEEALAAIEESVGVYRRLAAVNPAAYEADLATGLHNLSLQLVAAGRRKEGRAAIEKAVQMRRRLVAANPAAYERDLAQSLRVSSTYNQ